MENTNKDWKGNEISVFKGMGATNHSQGERQIHDYYATEPKAINLLLELEKFNPNIWECCCGEGHLSKAMIEKGRSQLHWRADESSRN